MMAAAGAFAWAEFAGCTVFFLLLAKLSFDDVRVGMLYDRWVFLLALAGLFFTVLGQLSTLDSAFLGAALGGSLLLFVRRLSHGGLGGGDVKLAAALGVWTGVRGILPALFCAFLLGSLWAVFLLARGYGRKAQLPFGPCLAAGGAVGVFFGEEIAAAYEALL